MHDPTSRASLQESHQTFKGLHVLGVRLLHPSRKFLHCELQFAPVLTEIAGPHRPRSVGSSILCIKPLAIFFLSNSVGPHRPRSVAVRFSEPSSLSFSSPVIRTKNTQSIVVRRHVMCGFRYPTQMLNFPSDFPIRCITSNTFPSDTARISHTIHCFFKLLDFSVNGHEHTSRKP